MRLLQLLTTGSMAGLAKINKAAMELPILLNGSLGRVAAIEDKNANDELALNRHNEFRAQHIDTSPLVFDPLLCAAAQASADSIAAKRELSHDFSDLKARAHGENLGMQWARPSPPPVNYTTTIDAWYLDEIGFYNYSHPGFSIETSHFTQVVWKLTTSFCMRHTFSDDGLEVYYAARYVERGNKLRRFGENVMPLKVQQDKEHFQFEDVFVDGIQLLGKDSTTETPETEGSGAGTTTVAISTTTSASDCECGFEDIGLGTGGCVFTGAGAPCDETTTPTTTTTAQATSTNGSSTEATTASTAATTTLTTTAVTDTTTTAQASTTLNSTSETTASTSVESTTSSAAAVSTTANTTSGITSTATTTTAEQTTTLSSSAESTTNKRTTASGNNVSLAADKEAAGEDLSSMNTGFAFVFNWMFGADSKFTPANLSKVKRIRSAGFLSRFPGKNQKLIKRLLKCESADFGTSNFARRTFSSNPKIALEQVVVMYRNWIEANLSKCSSPFKGIGKRKHLINRIKRWKNFLLIKFCRFVDPSRKFCKASSH